ncbi:MAG: GAF domain-containing sensor histidine kinase [Bacteroidetes bacterium]|nr:GAF domain-containing sensor histidine kinase [Bacteroidota bacterium]MBU1371815.1 GAF domain-containing sensor histidine kinase [Bacteroidota bacterium]MBU1483300.1 GAF domain-containing sensor histidine kinase [Bacteroidota bacterium]MBU1760276.1 GAF domain-containing sensor histidine kinase [Bacteroidota bacterium]MBU2267274.1 GAF domain-containing sensor histidine kinase [Bacteroidota bacterium]
MQAPVPENEMERLTSLSEFDLDYSDLEANFKDLTLLAAKVAGTPISLINLIDSYTQWTISSHGLNINQMPREESVCQYTILEDSEFEVKDLTIDERFSKKFYVADEPRLKYYLGVPLQTNSGVNIGALCVLDSNLKEISPEKVELLKIIANEIVNRLTSLKVIENLKSSLAESKETNKKVAHDIRGPLGGIIGLAQLIREQGDENKLEEVLEFIKLIQKSGTSLLELADEILSGDKKTPKLQSNEFNLLLLKDKLEKLYALQALNKTINFQVFINSKVEEVPFSKDKLLQIIGNLVSNALKFTPIGGSVKVNLDLQIIDEKKYLNIAVSDSGAGLTQEKINEILSGSVTSSDGTGGETGYGFGLALVKHLITGLKGTFSIDSTEGNGATFKITLPQV